MRKILLALTITLVLSFVFGSVLVLAANAAVPGDPLYSIDRELEAIQLELARSQSSALQLQKQLASEGWLSFNHWQLMGTSRKWMVRWRSLGLLYPHWKKLPMPVLCSRECWRVGQCCFWA